MKKNILINSMNDKHNTINEELKIMRETICTIESAYQSMLRNFNKIDKRFGDSLWRWSYDYPVKGKQDISNIDDPEFVALRRRRNTAVTCMYWIFFLGFFVLMNFISQVLLKIFV